MTNHVNKGLKKLSRPIWTRPSFRTRKSAKMERFHKSYQGKEKNNKSTYIEKQTHSLRTVRLLFKHQITT